MTLDVAFPTFTKMGQTYQYQALHDFNGKRLRATVHRDSYDRQSWGRIEVWSKTDDRWSTVVSREGEQLKHLPSPYVPDVETAARSDCERLTKSMLAEAHFVLGA